MEPLSALVKKMEDLGSLKGFSFPISGLMVSHLNFADDTIFFLDTDPLYVYNLVRMMRCFAIISGLQVNFHKSQVIGAHIDHSVVVLTAAKIFNLYSSLPFNYLGFPLGASPRRISTWNPLIQKIKNKLAFWKGRVLSQAGRLTLIKSTLTSLPLYYTFIFRIPKGVVRQHNTLINDFFLSGGSMNKKFHRVKWKFVTRLEKDGMGILDITVHNRALLSKWLWLLQDEGAALWARIVHHKYSVDHIDNIFVSSAKHYSTVWHNISKI